MRGVRPGTEILLEVRHRSARDRQHHRAAVQQPRECDLTRRRAVRLATVDRAARLRELAGGEREPRDEADAFFSQ